MAKSLHGKTSHLRLKQIPDMLNLIKVFHETTFQCQHIVGELTPTVQFKILLPQKIV